MSGSVSELQSQIIILQNTIDAREEALDRAHSKCDALTTENADLEARLQKLEHERHWAQQFHCSNCGVIGAEYITTKKTCAHCDLVAGGTGRPHHLVRSKHPYVKELEAQVKAADALADAAELREYEQYSTGEYPIASVRLAFRNAIDSYRATQQGATEGSGESTSCSPGPQSE